MPPHTIFGSIFSLLLNLFKSVLINVRITLLVWNLSSSIVCFLRT